MESVHVKEEVSINQSLKESFTFSCDDISSCNTISCNNELQNFDHISDKNLLLGAAEVDDDAIKTHFAWEHSSPEDSIKPEIHEFEFSINLSEEIVMNKRDGFMGTLFSPADDLFYNGHILPLNHLSVLNYRSIPRESPQGPQPVNRHHYYLPVIQDSSRVHIDSLRRDEQKNMLHLVPWLYSQHNATEDSISNHQCMDQTLMMFQHQLDFALQMIQQYEVNNHVIHNNDNIDGEQCLGEYCIPTRIGWINEEKKALTQDPNLIDDDSSLKASILNNCVKFELELGDSTTNQKSFDNGKEVENGLRSSHTTSDLNQGLHEISSKKMCDSNERREESGFLCRKRRSYRNLMKYVLFLKSLFLHIKWHRRRPRNMSAIRPVGYTIPRVSWSLSSSSLSTLSSTSTSSSSSSSVDHDSFKIGSSKRNLFKCSKRNSNEARSGSILKDHVDIQMPSYVEVENSIRGAIEHCKKSSAQAGKHLKTFSICLSS